MLYRPSGALTLWDTWIFPNRGEFHLYHLLNDPEVRHRMPFDLGHAVSGDLIHWEACPDIPIRGMTHGRTGMVIRHSDRYAMTIGWGSVGAPESVGLLFSDDLYHWEAHSRNPIITAASPYLDAGDDIDWRDAALYKIDQGYEALICARLPNGAACIARLYSHNLLSWDYDEPAAAPPVTQCEVPEYFAMGGRHYLIFSCGGAVDTPSRAQARGTHYLISDARGGPYVMPRDSLLIGSGAGRRNAYVGRIVPTDHGPLLYYHNCGPRPSLGAPKLIHQEEDGSLWAGYWTGMEGLETEVLLDRSSVKDLDSAGRSNGQEVVLLQQVVNDFHLSCSVRVPSSRRTLVIFRFDEKSDRGTAFSMDADSGRLEIGVLDGREWTTWESVVFPLESDRDHRVRLYARAEFVDVFVDDRLVFSEVLTNCPTHGRVGFAVTSSSARFSNLRIAALEPL